MKRHCQAEKAADISSIPRDVFVYDVLSKLPFKSVTKLKCVCKAWRPLIDESTDLFWKPIKESSLGILVCQRVSYADYHDDFIKVNVCSLQKAGGIQTLTTLSFRNIGSNSIAMMQSINGLICVTKQDEFQVCNPLTRQVVILPDWPHPLMQNRYWYFYDGFGFGYNALTDEYKVVRVVHLSSFEEVWEPDLIITYCAVFTLGSRPSWKKIKGPDYPVNEHAVYVDGAIYWLAGWDVAKFIVSYDIQKEIFMTSSPPFIQYDHFKRKDLLLIENKLCMATQKLDKETDIDIWMMLDDGSWVKKLVIPFEEYGQYSDPTGHGFDFNCLDNQKIIIKLSDPYGKYISYDMKSKVAQAIDSDGNSRLRSTTCFSWGNFLTIRGAQQLQKNARRVAKFSPCTF